MAEFVIEDTQTGLKLAVEGDTTPTQEDSHALIGDELQTLRTNLYELPGGRFMLDVGPNSSTRQWLHKSMFYDISPFVHARINEMYPEGLKQGPEELAKYNADLDRIWAEETSRMDLGKLDPSRNKRTFQTLTNLPEGTFLLSAHGYTNSTAVTNGGLMTEWDHEFSLHNVAQLLGVRSNDVRNFINTACYGGMCNPEDYEAAFPNVTNIFSTASTNENAVSIRGDSEGKFFDEGVGTSRWIKENGKWIDANRIQPIMPSLVPMHDVAP